MLTSRLHVPAFWTNAQRRIYVTKRTTDCRQLPTQLQSMHTRHRPCGTSTQDASLACAAVVGGCSAQRPYDNPQLVKRSSYDEERRKQLRFQSHSDPTLALTRSYRTHFGGSGCWCLLSVG